LLVRQHSFTFAAYQRFLLVEARHTNEGAEKLNVMDNFNLIIDKYRDTVSVDSIKARNYIKKLDYKNNFYLLQCIAQTYFDESRFVVCDGTDIMRKEMNFRKWRMAEKYIIKAFELNPNNAETLYTMGEIRKSNYQDEIAIYCFEKLIKLGVNRVAKQKYSRGRNFAKELINDAKFELYRLHHHNNRKLAEKYLQQYKKELEKGTTTIYKPLNKFLLKTK
jgi:tetratricopeptide (TPR) repeat protein